MKKFDLKFIAESAVIMALYVAITWLFSATSYEAIQFRISEVLVLLVLYKKKYAIPLILACLISNILSPLGWYDILFGTLATAIAIIPMLFVRNIYVAAIFPVISNMFIVPVELALAFGEELFEPAAFWYNVFTVGIGEAIVLYFLGIPFMLSIYNNRALVKLLDYDTTNVKIRSKVFNLYNLLSTLLGSLFTILFFANPLTKINGEEVIYNSAFFLILNNGSYYLITILVLIVSYVL